MNATPRIHRPGHARKATGETAETTETTRTERIARPSVRGRGAAHDPPNRFERLHYSAEADLEIDGLDDDPERPRTLYMADPSRTILARNDSPDVGFDVSVNPYRGCSHGCAYCYARPTHEYLGYSAGLDFETRILVKERAPQLLASALAAKSWRPRVIGFSGVTDAYQPIERRIRLTRRCLEVLRDFRNPVTVVTKNALVARDADLLAELAQHRAAAVTLSITTLDAELQRVMEPRASHPQQRLRAIERLAAAGIPVGVNVAPVIPGLTDHEIPAILGAAAAAGATAAAFLVVRLPYGVADLFVDWLERRRPERKDKVLNRIRSMRGGRLNDPRFGMRHRGEGLYAQQIRQLFEVTCRRHGLEGQRGVLSTEAFRRPPEPQLELFGPG